MLARSVGKPASERSQKGLHEAMVLLIIEILHYLKDPKLWELWVYSLLWGNAGFISSTVSEGFHGLSEKERVGGPPPWPQQAACPDPLYVALFLDQRAQST